MKDDVMGPTHDSAFESLSSVSLGFLEATGWYKAVYAAAEPMNWGHDTGCPFVEDKCVQNGVAVDSRHFCTAMYTEVEWACTVDRMAYG